MKKIAIISVVVILIGLIGWKLYSNKQVINENNKPVDRSMIAIPVSTEAAAYAKIEGGFSLPSVLKPVDEANVTLNTSGKIKSLNFDLGTKVHKGQVLGTVDTDLQQINLKTAELQVSKLKSDYDRMVKLHEGNAVTQVDLDNVKFQYDNAKFQVESLKQQIANGTLISPINGIITSKKVEVGEFISIGTPAAHVVDLAKMKTMVKVSEKDAYRIKEGMKVNVTSDIFPDKPLIGEIRYISPNGDQNHNYEVEVIIPGAEKEGLKAGTFVSVNFDITSSDNVLQIPKKALVEGITNPYVYVAKDNKPVVHKLVLGRDLGENVEVMNGIEEGELVITSGQINLSDKSIIKLIK